MHVHASRSRQLDIVHKLLDDQEVDERLHVHEFIHGIQRTCTLPYGIYRLLKSCQILTYGIKTGSLEIFRILHAYRQTVHI